MKVAVLALAASAAVVSASPGGEIPVGVPINCAKANANYCMDGDIILRCDGNKLGVRGRCSDNVSGYPPFGGLATCYQSSEDAGDAACQKNCVVYAAQPFTLPADKCTPSVSSTPSIPPPCNGTSTRSTSTPVVTTTPTCDDDTHIITTTTKSTSFTTTPISTTPLSSHLPCPNEQPPTSSSTGPTTTLYRNATISRTATTGPLSTTGLLSTTGPASTTGPTSTPTAAANVNQAAGVLAAAGFIAALFL
ncbi:hypothetical protein E4U55_004978 [Claviceps digitariae]|nr:hypothetical protein E4U55_004978 [Claviceps digitariae]